MFLEIRYNEDFCIFTDKCWTALTIRDVGLWDGPRVRLETHGEEVRPRQFMVLVNVNGLFNVATKAIGQC